MDKPGEILLIRMPEETKQKLESALTAEGYAVSQIELVDELHVVVERLPPQCMIFSLADPAALCLLTELKSDSVLRHVPAMALVPAEILETIQWRDVPADDYLVEPVSSIDLLMRVRLCILRARRELSANPLTGLPGNTAILQETDRRIAASTPFAVAYLDLDNFKPFNDRYGFSRGDEVLRMTSRVIVNAVRSGGGTNGYAGHVGGDDFIFMTDSAHIEKVCNVVVENFDMLIPNFYDNEDRAAGTIHSVDRKEQEREFPIMACSIAVVDSSQTEINNLAEISARTADLKKLAKSLPGSNFLVDRRS